MNGYYYLHTNGDLIYKPHGEVCDLRDSDFVRAFWPIDTGNRASGWTLLVEALSLGANKDRINELADKWGCSDKDAEHYADHVGARITIDGNQFCATANDFENLQDYPAGFGSSALFALAELAKELGYKASKMWGASFQDLLSGNAKAGAA